jgi:hypothetical protein
MGRVLLAGCAMFFRSWRAQGLEHVYGDYFHLNQTTSQSITDGSGETLLRESNMHLRHGEFGPKREPEHWDRFSWPKWDLTSLDLGDEMYFNARTHNNFQMALGPFYESVVPAASASDQAGESAGGLLQRGIHYGGHKEHGKWS